MTLRNAISVPTTEKGQMADSNYNKAHLLSLPNGGSLGEAGITLIETIKRCRTIFASAPTDILASAPTDLVLPQLFPSGIRHVWADPSKPNIL
jgi:hypothetical protein